MSEHSGRAVAGNGRASVPPGPAVPKGRRQRRPTGAPPPLPHPVTITTPRRSLRERATELEQAIWIVPVPDPADVDPLVPGPVRVRARSRW